MRALPLMLRPGLLILFTTALIQAQTCACTIPVFRYALDRWETDRFQLIVPASPSPGDAVTDLLRPLRANGRANLDITTAREPGVTQATLLDSKTRQQKIWSGTLDKSSLDSLLDSPGRQKILRHILAGDSIIWVIVGDGSPGAKADADRVEKRLKFLENVASLPIQDPNDPDSQLGPGPALRLKFTTLRIDAKDPAEQILISMLAGPEGRITRGQAFAAPVFGRGRVLGSWPLSQLDDAALEESSMFLVGRCSCRVKNENPGWDLLLNVDWEKALKEAGENKGATPAAVTAPAKLSVPETVVSSPSPPAASARPASSPEGIPQSTILLTSSAVLLCAVGLLLFRSRGTPNKD
ncbi:MAG: hypothetical protein CJBNEKGG_00263 [Prosthecobacter sp.]|nr:hypothetical protein [Prosthecobacter sp.]